QLVECPAPVGSEAGEADELPLAYAATFARFPGDRPAYEQRVRLHGDHLVATDDDGVGHLEVARGHAEQRLRSVHRLESHHRPTVVELDVGRDRRGPTI